MIPAVIMVPSRAKGKNGNVAGIGIFKCRYSGVEKMTFSPCKTLKNKA